MQKKYKYLVGVLIIAGVLAALMLTTFRQSLQYYVTVSELMADTETFQSRELKVAGKASEIRKQEGADRLTYHFVVTEGGKSLPVTYVGLSPDTFKEGADVVATGRLMPDGHLEAHELLAKCASKYEAKLK